MPAFLERIARGEVLVSDGALGTMLIKSGLPPGRCPELLNLSAPEKLEEISRHYLEAGAELVQTNSFGGSPLKLAEHGLEEQTEAINRAAVENVRRAVGSRALVCASCGPSGRILKPYGDTDAEVVRASFERQLRALVEAGADLLCIETMTDLQEARLAIEAARAVSKTVPILASMTFDETPRGFYTIMGVTPAAAAAGLRDAGADVVGSNCGNGIEVMIRIARALKAAATTPVLVQSNAGKPELVGGEVRYLETPHVFAQQVPALLDAGVAIIGGCCGTTPEHIRVIRQIVDERRVA